MPQQALASRTKKSDADNLQERRCVILDQTKLKPTMAAWQYLRRASAQCPKECVSVAPDKKITVSEDLCLGCLNRVKKCPEDAVKVVKLPSNLGTDTTHQYGTNCFKLHHLPMPSPGQVLGILGCNGTGKSTACSILAGKLKPNLGNYQDTPTWKDIIKYYRGSDLQKYFTALVEDRLTVSFKPQMDSDYAKKLEGKRLGELIEKKTPEGTDPERVNYILQEMELTHLLDRDCGKLSGGEIQRLAITLACIPDVNVYIFDEPTSFLDVKQRLAATRLIRSLASVDDGSHTSGAPKNGSGRYVVAIEHDLAILDYMSDFVHCMYGEPGMYGAVTKRAGVRNGINNFLAGYFPAENMRFRAEELNFKFASQSAAELGLGLADAKKVGCVSYPAMTKVLSSPGKESTFTLHIAAGQFEDAEVVGMLGQNGMGKTTYMELLAGLYDKKKETQKGGGGAQDEQPGSDGVAAQYDCEPISLLDHGCSVSYKRQDYAPKYRRYKGTVRELLERNVTSYVDSLFKLFVLRPLQMEELMEFKVATLSGGELQRLAIVVCLGTPALVYLLDEPSAGLDCEQRVKVARVIRRWATDHLKRTCFVIEHDAVMMTALADKMILFSGVAGVEATASGVMPMAVGYNAFLRELGVTFRRDPCNNRPRINKPDSIKDREQKQAGNYFCFDFEDGAEGKEDGDD